MRTVLFSIASLLFLSTFSCKKDSLSADTATPSWLDSTLTNKWDPINKKWLTWNKRTFAYSTQGVCTGYINSQKYKNPLAWGDDSKVTLTTDCQGNLTYFDGYNFDATTGKWKLWQQEKYILDDQGRKIGAWISFLDAPTNKMMLVQLSELSYDANGLPQQQKDYLRDDPGGEWVYFSRYEFTYNASKLFTGLTTSYRNSDSEIWYSDYRCEVLYDPAGNPTIVNHFTLDYTRGIMVNTFRDEYTYDPQRKISEVKTPGYSYFMWENCNGLTHIPVQCMTSTFQNGVWINQWQKKFYFSNRL